MKEEDIDVRRMIGSIPCNCVSAVWINQDGSVDIEWGTLLLTLTREGALLLADTDDGMTASGSFVVEELRARLCK